MFVRVKVHVAKTARLSCWSPRGEQVLHQSARSLLPEEYASISFHEWTRPGYLDQFLRGLNALQYSFNLGITVSLIKLIFIGHSGTNRSAF